MKTLILTTALVVLTTLTFSQNDSKELKSHAPLNTDEVNCSIFPNENDIVTFILEKDSGQIVNVKVKDAHNKLVYQKRFKKVNQARIKFDINQFPEGNYTFELTKGKEVLYSQVIKKSDKLLSIAR